MTPDSRESSNRPRFGRVFISSVFGGMFDLRRAAAEAAELVSLKPVLTDKLAAQPTAVRDTLHEPSLCTATWSPRCYGYKPNAPMKLAERTLQWLGGLEKHGSLPIPPCTWALANELITGIHVSGHGHGVQSNLSITSYS